MADEIPGAAQISALHAKINAIAKETPGLVKDKTNTFHRYDYVSAESVVETVGSKAVEAGLNIIRSVVPDSIKLTNRGDNVLVTAEFAFHITDVDTGYRERYTQGGSGEDKGDKGLYKAATGAKKQFLMDLFQIPQVEDESDPDNASDPIGTGKKRGAGTANFNPADPFGKKGLPFGDSKGKTVEEADLKDLCWILPKLADDNPKWSARNKSQRLVVYQEIVNRWNDGLSEADQELVKKAKGEYKKQFPDG